MTVTHYKSSTSISSSQNVVTSLALHDLAIAWALTDGTGNTFTWPSGFVEQQVQTCIANGGNLGWALKLDCTGSEGTLTVGSSGSCIAGIVGVSSANNSALDVASPTAYNNNSLVASPWTGVLSITPTTNGDVLLAIIMSDVNSNTVSTVHTFADTGGLSWTVDEHHDTTGWFQGAIAYATQATAAATTVTGTGTGATNSSGVSMFLAAIKAASGGGSSPPIGNSCF